jgi:mono/diheme cytochrome c family protein
MPNKRWLFQLRALPQAALAVAACATGSTALAQNAANGQVLYQTRVAFPVSGGLSCEDCHGPAYIFRAASTAGAISAAISANRGGMSAFAFLSAAQVADIAAYVTTAVPPPPPPPITPPPAGSPPAATPMASPNPAVLPNTTVGSTSAVVNVQFTNTAGGNVTFNTPAIGAASGDAADFLVATPTAGTAQCISGRVMAAGMSCWFGVQFKPTAAGTRTVTWTVNFVGSVAPRTLTLQGSASATGAPAPAPAPAPSPTPSPAPAPAPSPTSANAPTSGGGGALDWTSLLGLAALAGAAGTRRRTR